MKKLICTLMFATLATAAAKASTLTITLDQVNQTGAAGGMVEFLGTIVNNSGSTIYLNSDALNFSSPGFTIVDQFFTTVPISLNPKGTAGNSSGDIELFDIDVNSPFGNAPGKYSGVYTLLGGNDGGADTAQDNLGSVAFSVNVGGTAAAAPEPSSICLVLTGLVGLGAAASRKLRGLGA